MGRPKTPIEVMEARSKGGKTPGKRNLPAPYKGPRNAIVPDPPRPFTGRALDEWDSIWAAGFWLKPDQDFRWVEMIAGAYEEIEQYRREIASEGLTVRGYNGQMVAHPLIAEIRKCEAMIQKCLQVLGFSPTDRAKLAIREAEARSALQKMMDESREGRS